MKESFKNYSILFLFPIFTFWSTLRVLDPLWPGVDARPLALPAYWLFMTALNAGFMAVKREELFGKKINQIIGIVILFPLPAIIGWLALVLQISRIGFNLSE